MIIRDKQESSSLPDNKTYLHSVDSYYLADFKLFHIIPLMYSNSRKATDPAPSASLKLLFIL